MDQSIQAGNVSQVLDDDMMQAEESRQMSDEDADIEAPSSRLMNSMDQSIQAGNVSQVLDDDMMQAEESRQMSDEEAEMSYIYGDEDSSHHQLDIVDESATDSDASGAGYASNGVDDEERRNDTPPPDYDEGGKVPTVANGASRTLEMKQVASSSVASDGDEM